MYLIMNGSTEMQEIYKILDKYKIGVGITGKDLIDIVVSQEPKIFHNEIFYLEIDWSNLNDNFIVELSYLAEKYNLSLPRYPNKSDLIKRYIKENLEQLKTEENLINNQNNETINLIEENNMYLKLDYKNADMNQIKQKDPLLYEIADLLKKYNIKANLLPESYVKNQALLEIQQNPAKLEEFKKLEVLNEALIRKGDTDIDILKKFDSELSKISKKQEISITIIDGYIFPKKYDVNYVQIFEKFLKLFPKLENVNIITFSGYNKNIEQTIITSLPNYKFITKISDDFHDRFWITDTGTILSGASLNGLAKKYSIFTSLSDEDHQDLLTQLKSNNLI